MGRRRTGATNGYTGEVKADMVDSGRRNQAATRGRARFPILATWRVVCQPGDAKGNHVFRIRESGLFHMLKAGD
jgi:hypothetical protein